MLLSGNEPIGNDATAMVAQDATLKRRGRESVGGGGSEAGDQVREALGELLCTNGEPVAAPRTRVPSFRETEGLRAFGKGEPRRKGLNWMVMPLSFSLLVVGVRRTHGISGCLGSVGQPSYKETTTVLIIS